VQLLLLNGFINQFKDNDIYKKNIKLDGKRIKDLNLYNRSKLRVSFGKENKKKRTGEKKILLSF